jgi:transposase InsO family protein
MRAERIFARQRSKYRPRTTDSHHGGPIAPNRLPNLTIHRPDQAWVTDATCILTGQGWLYLVAVLDIWTRRVIGWAMHQILDAGLVIAALRMALLQRRPKAALVIHSDRGMQFASAAYRQVLAQHGLIASMSRKGNCYDNAFIESFWSSLKYEVVYHQRFATLTEARTAIFDYIETFYNPTRLHSSLAYQSPILFESKLNLNQRNRSLRNCPKNRGKPMSKHLTFWRGMAEKELWPGRLGSNSKRRFIMCWRVAMPGKESSGVIRTGFASLAFW